MCFDDTHFGCLIFYSFAVSILVYVFVFFFLFYSLHEIRRLEFSRFCSHWIYKSQKFVSFEFSINWIFFTQARKKIHVENKTIDFVMCVFFLRCNKFQIIFGFVYFVHWCSKCSVASAIYFFIALSNSS